MTSVSSSTRPAASERITLAIIGTGNQGIGDLKQFLKDERIQVVAVCDVNRESPGYWDGAIGGREPAKRIVEAYYAEQDPKYKGCRVYSDFRDVLQSKEIDAVEIATPDHWHASMVVAAAHACKHIYCQKPLSLTVKDGRAMSSAVKDAGITLQTGSQQRSDPHFHRACELVRNGRIGKLKTVRCGLPGGRPDIAKSADRKKPELVPDGFDYDMWLGPAPLAPYSPARCHVNFRWVLDYSGGQVTDWGGHHPDCAQWGMGTDHTGPIEIRNAKGIYPPDDVWNTASEFYFEAIYKSGVTMIISNKERGGVTWEGDAGWVWADRGRHEASSPKIMESEIRPGEIHLKKSANHFRNFIDCILSGEEPVSPVEAAHRSITIAHLGNIAMQLGRDSLKWNPDTEQILGDPEASAMLSRPYRPPWNLLE